MAIKRRGVNRFAWVFRTGTTGSTAPGISVTPGASNVEGSWVQMATGGNIANDVCMIRLRIAEGSASTAAKEMLLDIGWDPAGGTSYVEKISNMCVGETTHHNNSAPCTAWPREYVFPIRIPAGASVAVRVQGSHATPTALLVDMVFYGQPSHPELIRVGQWAETVGTITNSSGVTVAPGNTVDGSWVDLGTVSKRCWWWQLFIQNNTSAAVSRGNYFDLAWGDASNKTLIIRGLEVMVSASEDLACSATFPDGFGDVPAGAHLYVRGNGSGTSSNSFNAVAVGIGG